MKPFGVLLGVMIATAIAMVLSPGGTEPVLGLPVTNVADENTPAWIAFGGVGVLCLGAGVGVVSFTLYGGGVLFATGQITAGLICIGQLGVGVVFACVQVGAGLTGIGQGIAGGLVGGQGTLGFDGDEFLEQLDKDVSELLRVWRRG